MTPGKSELH